MEDNMDIDIEKKPADRVVLNIDKILDEASPRLFGRSLHNQDLTYRSSSRYIT